MNEQRWRDQRDDRTLRYAERRLDPERWIVITIDPEYLQRYEGQVALLTAANLLGRMSPSVAISFDDTQVHGRLPWAGRSLADVVLSGLRAADPFGHFCLRDARSTDHRLHFGRSGNEFVVHGLGWNAFLGPGPSPLLDSSQENPIGAALAAVLAVSQVFVHDFSPPASVTTMNALGWDHQLVGETVATAAYLGTIFFAGVGSVGTAALYFLTLSGREFKPTLLDMDVVKVHNLDRSPIFLDEDVGRLKVRAAERFLRDIGITPLAVDERPLHESALWIERPMGSPDVLIAAANEMNVRYHIESQYPPVQLYGTTGRNWQCSVIRHIPIGEACSCCLFPPDVPQPTMACATAPSSNTVSTQRVDAALPFLSFAAGLMTAAEVIKLGMFGYPFSANRVTLYTRPDARLVPAKIPRSPACICEERSSKVHRRMIEGSRYAVLTS